MNTTVDKSADKLVTNWIKDSSILLVKFRARLETSIANLASFLWLEKLELIRAESWEKKTVVELKGGLRDAIKIKVPNFSRLVRSW